jgi:hypothetical protein
MDHRLIHDLTFNGIIFVEVYTRLRIIFLFFYFKKILYTTTSLRKSCSSKKKKKLYLLGCIFSTRSFHENISICTLVPETVAIMHFSSRRGRETSSSNHHAFFYEMGSWKYFGLIGNAVIDLKLFN